MERYNKSTLERVIDLENTVDKLNLYAVSNRRELLVAMFQKMTQPQITMLEIGEYEKLADELLSS